jgi:hypothetical protein
LKKLQNFSCILQAGVLYFTPAINRQFPRELRQEGKCFFADLNRTFWAFGGSCITVARTGEEWNFVPKHQRRIMEERQHGNREVAANE